MRRRIILEGNKTEKVIVQVTMSDGASAQGVTVTINGSATTTNADGVAYGEVPFDTSYSVVFSQKNSTYSTPASQSFTANQETRPVSATYTKYYETCTATSNYATTITINGNSKSNTKSHSLTIPYGITYSVNVPKTADNGYTASTTSYTYTANTSSRSVTFTYVYDKYNGHAYVDFGLPSGTKWATMNVGASSSSDCGNYYKYGYGSEVYSSDTSTNWEYYKGDIAQANWGGSWRTPTKEQFEELINNTIITVYKANGIQGLKFTKNGDSSKFIFLKSCGYYGDGRYYNPSDNYPGYWSDTASSDDYAMAWRFYGNGTSYHGESGSGKVIENHKYLAFPVRPVIK